MGFFFFFFFFFFRFENKRNTRKEMENPSYVLLFSLIQAHYPEILLSLLSFFLLHFLFRRGVPLNLPIVGVLPHLILNSTHLHEWSTDVLRRNNYTYLFKSISGTPIDYLFTCDPSNVKHVFTTQFANYPKGKDFSVLFDVLGEGIFNVDFDSWALQRRKAHSLMSDSKFRTFVNRSTKNKLENGLLPLLEQIAMLGQVVDLQDVFLRLTFDLTSAFTFGVDPGCLVPDFPTVPFAQAMDKAEEILFYRHLAPLAWLNLQKKYNFGSHKEMRKACKVIDKTIDAYVSKRRELFKTGKNEEKEETSVDFLSSYLDCEKEVGKEGEDFNKFLRDTTFNIMVAGRDTTSSALTWFFYVLHNNPHVEQTILEELKLQAPQNPSFPTELELKRLVYLHAALCESLRLYPPVPFNHKVPLKHDILPSGVPVDRKRRILFSLYAMARMEGIWGKDCREFKPERWLTESGKIRHEPSYKFMSFNSGPRTCLGKDLAFTQMKSVVAAVLTRYHVEVIPGFEVVPRFSIILHMQEGLKVRLRPRV
ncbi:hypothetical protein LUZ60_009615 [Juncus effusus]|nr:hypothetical protein LUZ60_009615 [Juncus effusus]